MATGLTFLITTPAEKGSHKHISGLTGRVNAHSASVIHARRRDRRRMMLHPPQHVSTLNYANSQQHWITSNDDHLSSEEDTFLLQALGRDTSSEISLPFPYEGSEDVVAQDFNNFGNDGLENRTTFFPETAGFEKLQASLCTYEQPCLDLAAEDKNSRENHSSTAHDENFISSNSASWLSQRSTALKWRDHRYIPNEIGTKLDPFIRLPVELSAYEQNLLHYFMSEGRRMICGPSINPKYDYFLNIASRQMETCPLYALSRVTTAEVLILKLTDRGRLTEAYKRTGTMYKYARRIASDEHASLESRLSMLMNMTVTEELLQRPKFKIVHLQHLEDLVRSHGGLELFFKQRLNGTCMLEPYFLLTLFTWGAAPKFTRYLSFRKAVESFINMLQNIKHWMLSLHDLGDYRDSTHDHSHRRLDNYLYFLIDSYLRRPEHTVMDEGPKAFILLLNICMTFVELQCNHAGAASLLSRLQSDMIESVSPITLTESVFQQVATTSDNCDLKRLHPSQALGILCHMRRQIPHEMSNNEEISLSNVREEVKMCSISIDTAKLYPMLSRTTQVQLAGEFFKCIASIGSISGLVHCFDEVIVDDVKAELEESWHRHLHKSKTAS